MKINKLIKIITIVQFLITVAGCQKHSGIFELTGKLTGITDGKAILSSYGVEENQISDTVLIKNGEFIFSRDIPEPAAFLIKIEEKRYLKFFYAENAKMTLTGNADSLHKAVITGGIVNTEENKFNAELDIILNKLNEKHKFDSLAKIYIATRDETCKKLIDACSSEKRAVSNQLKLNFIKQNPSSYYSAILIEQMSYGNSAAKIEEDLLLLDPKLNETSIVKNLRKLVEDLKTTDVNVDAFTSNAPEMSYSVDKTFTGTGYKDMTYLATLSNDNLCALRKDGVVTIINSEGGKVGEFKSEINGNPSAIAVDESENVYVFGSISENRSSQSRGKTTQVETPVKVECLVFDSKGGKIRAIELADIVTATGARVADGKIMVADTRGRKVAIFNAQTGEKISTIENLRTCCGILDFSIRNNEILVANLGAFRVNGFDYTGKPTISFGQRGTGINDFHGCCNPVSVAFLSNGGIVTVEKDPTRIKVYSKGGAKQIDGIEELVKGCAYIPMTVDTKDNVYLASKKDGLVKCVPAK